MTVTFHDVTIMIDAQTPEAAYDRLCDVFQTGIDAHGDLEYATDTYSTDGHPDERSTYFLWPDNRKGNANDVP